MTDRDLLRRLEWSGRNPESEEDACPACDGLKPGQEDTGWGLPIGHAPNCELAAALAAPEPRADRDLLLAFVESLTDSDLGELEERRAYINQEKTVAHIVDTFLASRAQVVCERLTVEEAARDFRMGEGERVAFREADAVAIASILAPAPHVKVTEVEGSLRDAGTYEECGACRLDMTTPGTTDYAYMGLEDFCPDEACPDGASYHNDVRGRFKIAVEFWPAVKP